MTTHEQLVGLFENYVMENQKFTEKGPVKQKNTEKSTFFHFLTDNPSFFQFN